MSDVHKRVINKNKKQFQESQKEPHDDSNHSKSKTEEYKRPKLLPRIYARVVVIFSLLIIVYYSSKNSEQLFAGQSVSIPGIVEKIDCSTSFLKEINQYVGCFPKFCGRVVSDEIVSTRESEELLKIAQKGLKFGGSFGGATILDLHSGALSKGENFINIYKMNQAKDLFTPTDFNLYKVITNKIKSSVAQQFGVDQKKIYLTHPTFFSKLTADKPFGAHDEYWHPHVDKQTYKSFHYTTLLYLNDYSKDFEGGKFVFIEDKYNKTIEPRKGRVSMFTSGAENPHFVQRVTKGVRYAITIAFTCDKKYAISDPSIL